MKVVIEPKATEYDDSLYDAPRVIDAGFAGFESVGEDALESYYKEGYIVIRQALDAQLVEEARRELEAMTNSDQPNCKVVMFEGQIRDYMEESAAPSKERGGKKDSPKREELALGDTWRELPGIPADLRGKFVRKFSGFVEDHGALAAIAMHPALLKVVSLLAGEPVNLFQDMAMVKPPGGREKPWHQDHAYFNLPIDTSVVGVWIALDQVTQQNGCMHVLPGGHRSGPRIHFMRRDWQICDEEMFGENIAALPMEVGDVLLFDTKLPHGTPANKSNLWRWALQFHYCPITATAASDEERLALFGSEGKNVTC